MAEIGKLFDSKALAVHLEVLPELAGGDVRINVYVKNLTADPRTVFLLSQKPPNYWRTGALGAIKLVNAAGRPMRLKSGSIFGKQQPAETTRPLSYGRSPTIHHFPLPPNQFIKVFTFNVREEFDLEEADEYELILVPQLYYIAAVKGDEGVFKRQEFPPVTARMIVPVRK